MTKATIIGNASTQSRGKRPGKPLVSDFCSGVHEHSIEDFGMGRYRKILSWPMAQYGPLLGFPHVDNPLTKDLIDHLHSGMEFGYYSLGSYLPYIEQELADKLATLYAPYLRSPDIGIRFFSNGTDATQCAVALARYATGREAFVSVGYHGGSSPVFNSAPQNRGVLRANEEGRFDIPFGGDLGKADWDHLACAILEAPAVEDEVEAGKWINEWEGCGAGFDVPLIMDEIVTGFRLSSTGALGHYSSVNRKTHYVDFVVLGKALSTYGKVSALLGPRDVMEALSDKVFASYTFNDHPLGFADALWTLGEYEKHKHALYGDWNTYAGNIGYVGDTLRLGLNSLFDEYSFPAKCIGHPARSAIVPTDDGTKLWTLLSRVVDEHDILLHRPQFVTLAHNLDHVAQTLTAVETVLKTWEKE